MLYRINLSNHECRKRNWMASIIIVWVISLHWSLTVLLVSLSPSSTFHFPYLNSVPVLAQLLPEAHPLSDVEPLAVGVSAHILEGRVEDSVHFLLRNFQEMNKLWVRTKYKREWDSKEREQHELGTLIGANLMRLSQLESLDVPLYQSVCIMCVCVCVWTCVLVCV